MIPSSWELGVFLLVCLECKCALKVQGPPGEQEYSYSFEAEFLLAGLLRDESSDGCHGVPNPSLSTVQFGGKMSCAFLKELDLSRFPVLQRLVKTCNDEVLTVKLESAAVYKYYGTNDGYVSAVHFLCFKHCNIKAMIIVPAAGTFGLFFALASRTVGHVQVSSLTRH